MSPHTSVLSLILHFLNLLQVKDSTPAASLTGVLRVAQQKVWFKFPYLQRCKKPWTWWNSSCYFSPIWANSWPRRHFLFWFEAFCVNLRQFYDKVSANAASSESKTFKFQSGKRLVKKRSWTPNITVIYLWHTKWFNAEKSPKTLKCWKSLISQCNLGSWPQKSPKNSPKNRSLNRDLLNFLNKNWVSPSYPQDPLNTPKSP